MEQWMRGALGQMARDVLLDGRTRQRGIYNIPYVESLFQRHDARLENYSGNIWSLLVLETWMRTFVDGAPGIWNATHRQQ
jgi:asparagine synthase (glutamine-hydrolysing)